MQAKTIFVLQFRTDQSEAHDRICLTESLEEINISFKFFNPTRNEMPNNLDEADGIILSGSGEFFITKEPGKDTWMPQVLQSIDEALAKDIPLLGLCFGSQLLAKHQGAEISKEKQYSEVGVYEILMFDIAKSDPIFSSMPEKYTVILGHKETPINLPDNLVALGRSDQVPAQAIRVKGKNAWSVLFHPEINKKQLLERLSMFPEYIEDRGKLEELNKTWGEVPHAVEVIRSFARFIIDHKK